MSKTIRSVWRFSRAAGVAAICAIALAPAAAAGDGKNGELNAPESKKLHVLIDEALAIDLAALPARECKPECTTTKCCSDCGYVLYDQALAPAKHLNEILSARPEAWKIVEPTLVALFEGGSDESRRATALELLTWQKSERAHAVALRIWNEAPDAFSDVHLLAFAQAGAKEFFGCIEKRIAKGKCESVRPAAFLAFHGNGAGRAALKTACSPGKLSREKTADALLAAAALAHLGDPKPQQELERAVHAKVLAALDSGDLETARCMAVQAEFAAQWFPRGKALLFGQLDESLGQHAKKRSDALASADQVFELIESVFPL